MEFDHRQGTKVHLRREGHRTPPGPSTPFAQYRTVRPCVPSGSPAGGEPPPCAAADRGPGPRRPRLLLTQPARGGALARHPACRPRGTARPGSDDVLRPVRAGQVVDAVIVEAEIVAVAGLSSPALLSQERRSVLDRAAAPQSSALRNP